MRLRVASVMLVCFALVSLTMPAEAGDRRSRQRQEAQATWSQCEAQQCWKNATSNKQADTVAIPKVVTEQAKPATATATECQGGACNASGTYTSSGGSCANGSCQTGRRRR